MPLVFYFVVPIYRKTFCDVRKYFSYFMFTQVDGFISELLFHLKRVIIFVSPINAQGAAELYSSASGVLLRDLVAPTSGCEALPWSTPFFAMK